MGREDAHLRKAKHNEYFLRLIQNNDSQDTPIFPDWAITAVFYVVLHYIDKKLAKLNLHPRNHGDRNSYVANKLATLYAEYGWLKSKSEYARYYTDSENKIPLGTVQRALNLIPKFSC